MQFRRRSLGLFALSRICLETLRKKRRPSKFWKVGRKPSNELGRSSTTRWRHENTSRSLDRSKTKSCRWQYYQHSVSTVLCCSWWTMISTEQVRQASPQISISLQLWSLLAYLCLRTGQNSVDPEEPHGSIRYTRSRS